MTHLKHQNKTKTKDMALIGLMTAVICALAPFSFPLPFSPVPFTLATLAISFATVVLGWKQGCISVLLYLFLGFAGMPVFSGFSGGAGKLLGPTGGYLIGYLFLALVGGLFYEKWPQARLLHILGLLLGTASCYLFGTLWLARQSELTFGAALITAVLPFLPGDLLKLAIAVLVGGHLRSRLRKANLI